MSKTYKGYELYKMIAEGKIKDDCKIKDTKTKYIAIWDGYNFRLEDNNYLRDGYDEIGFAKRDFELIEDEIDIQQQEINWEEVGQTVGKMYIEFAKGFYSAIEQLIRKKEDKQ